MYDFYSFGYSWTTFLEVINDNNNNNNNNNNAVEPPVSDHPKCKD